MCRFALIILFGFLATASYAQDEDSLKLAEKEQKKELKEQKKAEKHKIDTSYHHSVKAAVLLSTVVPGAGQIYNEIGHWKFNRKPHRSWWKVPIIYGGLATTFYFLSGYMDTTNLMRKEINYRYDTGNPYYHSEYAGIETSSIIGSVDGYDFQATRRDLFIFLAAGIYGLQIIEALVDAHMVTFDASSDLSFYWRPTMLDMNTAGLSVGLRF